MSKTLINGVLSNINGSKYVSVTLECDSTITNMKYAFCNCNTLVSFNSIGLENVTNAYQMFCFCENLTSIDTSGFTGITNAIGMFAGCTSLTSIDASSFENVTSAYQMFDSCENLTSIDVSGFTSVTETDMMFNQCKNLLFITGGEIFNSNLTSYYREFFACKSLRRIFCNTETNVTATKEFLTNDTYLPSTFDVSTMVRQGVDFSKLNDTLASLATNTAATPYEMNVLNYTADNLAGSPSAKENTFQYILKNNSKKYVTLNCILDDDGNVDYSAVCVNNKFLNKTDRTDFDRSFSLCGSLVAVALGEKPTKRNSMFAVSSLKNYYLDVTDVVDVSYMFISCTNLTSIDTSAFTNVTNVLGMFVNCTSLTEITNWAMDINKLSSYRNIFTDCPSTLKIYLKDDITTTDNVLSLVRLNVASDGTLSVTKQSTDETQATTSSSTVTIGDTIRFTGKIDEIAVADEITDDEFNTMFKYRYEWSSTETDILPTNNSFVLWAKDSSNIKTNIINESTTSSVMTLSDDDFDTIFS